MDHVLNFKRGAGFSGADKKEVFPYLKNETGFGNKFFSIGTYVC
jgi:hypothetical protein